MSVLNCYVLPSLNKVATTTTTTTTTTTILTIDSYLSVQDQIKFIFKCAGSNYDARGRQHKSCLMDSRARATSFLSALQTK